MVFGRPKGFKVSDETKAKQLAWFSSPLGQAHRQRMRELMKQCWVEQKGGKK